jgi:broad-specificity NMP kinase
MSGVKIIWLDGTFGVGKTTVSRALNKKIPEFKILDSDEYFQMFSKKNPLAAAFGGALPQNKESFIQYFRKIIDEEIANGTTNLIVVMAVTFEESREGLLNYFKDKGVEIAHIILQANKDVLQDRIMSDKQRDQDFALQRMEWNLKFLEQHYSKAMRIDTDNMGPEDIADAIISLVMS